MNRGLTRFRKLVSEVFHPNDVILFRLNHRTPSVPIIPSHSDVYFFRRTEPRRPIHFVCPPRIPSAEATVSIVFHMR